MNVGDKVVIKECHKIPQIVGLAAEVIGVVHPDYDQYPIKVKLVEKTKLESPMGTLETDGPFPFREDELEAYSPTNGIPKHVLDAFEEKGEGEATAK